MAGAVAGVSSAGAAARVVVADGAGWALAFALRPSTVPSALSRSGPPTVGVATEIFDAARFGVSVPALDVAEAVARTVG